MTPHANRTEFERRVRAAAGAWVEYGRDYASRRSASSRANQLRRLWPEFEIRQQMGVVSVRLRMEGDSQ